jgi:hydrogenase maturation protease
MTAAIETRLQSFVKGRLCLLGFGNRMWRDDGVGSLLAARLENCPGLDSVDGGMTPENHLEKVAGKEPGTVLLADAADFGGAPGETRLFEAGEIALAGLSTHAGSPRMLAAYLEARTGAPVALLAIQPGDVSQGSELSSEVSGALNHLHDVLKDL